MIQKILFLVVVILSCEAAPPVTYPSNPNYYNYTPDQNVPYHRLTRDDEKVLARIYKKLQVWFERGYQGQIKVDIVNGDVTLTGTVDSQSDKDDIEHRVRSAYGVRRINNQIEVHTPIW